MCEIAGDIDSRVVTLHVYMRVWNSLPLKTTENFFPELISLALALS